jgi:hypothetical protein
MIEYYEWGLIYEMELRSHGSSGSAKERID